MAAVLAEILKIDNVSVDGHFFDDLGADSMLMAQFCAKLRKRPDLPTVSIKDVYRHTTITALAAVFGGATAGPRNDAATPAPRAPRTRPRSRTRRRDDVAQPSRTSSSAACSRRCGSSPSRWC